MAFERMLFKKNGQKGGLFVLFSVFLQLFLATALIGASNVENEQRKPADKRHRGSENPEDDYNQPKKKHKGNILKPWNIEVTKQDAFFANMFNEEYFATTAIVTPSAVHSSSALEEPLSLESACTIAGEHIENLHQALSSNSSDLSQPAEYQLAIIQQIMDAEEIERHTPLENSEHQLKYELNASQIDAKEMQTKMHLAALQKDKISLESTNKKLQEKIAAMTTKLAEKDAKLARRKARLARLSNQLHYSEEQRKQLVNHLNGILTSTAAASPLDPNHIPELFFNHGMEYSLSPSPSPPPQQTFLHLAHNYTQLCSPYLIPTHVWP